MQISEVPNTPPRIKAWLKEIAKHLKTVDPSAGQGILLDKKEGQGTRIGIDPSTGTGGSGGGGVCSPTAPPDTGTWVWGSVDGVCGWVSTTACDPPA